ncbi:MAG: cytochrome c biogenesis CcdA family protein [Actinomycetota bacterium]
MSDPTVALAFLAGLASFLSPCVLPLVPGYLSYMSGLAAGAEKGTGPGARPAIVAFTFVLGFTLVFVPLGATATYLGSFLGDYQRELARVGGLVIILMGLVFMGVIKVPWLYREARFHPRPEAGVGGSMLLGAAFAFGWTPCIGATMGAVLTMAAGRGGENGSMGEGAFLLTVYSLGLGVPFILAGLGMSRLTTAVAWLRKHTRAITYASGVLLIAVGVLFVTDQVFRLSIWMQRAFNDLNLDFWSEI